MSEGAIRAEWTVRFTGFGCVVIRTAPASPEIYMAPQAVSSPERTSAPLVVGPRLGGAFRYSVRLTTDHQLRTGTEPNPWEVAWVVWNYSDDAHFYYFIPKPNGWELGKRDPAYPGGQRFLATGASPSFEIGRSYDVEVRHADGSMEIWVDGVQVTAYTDRERPYASGRVGLYSEDAVVRFGDVRVSGRDVLEERPL